MTYEFSAGDDSYNIPNPYKIENIFLLLSTMALLIGGGGVLYIARGYLGGESDKVGIVTAVLAFSIFGTAVTFGIQALSQIRFFFGRNFPLGLAEELLPSAVGTSPRATLLQETLRQRAIHFPEPDGPLNGVLYSLIKPLIVSPPTIQFAAIRHFHALIGMLAILASLACSFFLFNATPSEGVVSWLYLPLTGLSLATPFIKKEDTNQPPTSGAMLWSLIGLVGFAMLAPVIAPRYLPAFPIPPMWIAPAALLITSIISSALFLASLFSNLDGTSQTSVSCELVTIDMNCPPSQLWTEIGRDFQQNWVRSTPNRSYINLPPEVSGESRGTFQGHILEETQPTATSTMAFSGIREAFNTPYARYLILLCGWGAILSIVTAIAAVLFAQGFGDMSRFEISRSLLMVFALGTANILTFKTGHLLWSRMYFKSRLTWIETAGTFQTSELDVGNQFLGRARSRSKLTRVEDATLRVWMTDIVSVAFGKNGNRFIMAMAPAGNSSCIDSLLSSLMAGSAAVRMAARRASSSSR